jgi:PAS domain S-box-containing protein
MAACRGSARRFSHLADTAHTPSQARVEAIFSAARQRELAATDRCFFALLMVQWVAAVGIALAAGRYAEPAGSPPAVPLWTALIGGAVLNALPTLVIARRPGSALTRHVVAVVQMLWSVMFIHLTGGRIESHAHVFGSLAFIAFYRDWRPLVTAAVAIVAGQAVRHALAPLPGDVVGLWRLAERAAWTGFEEAVLIVACVRGLAEQRRAAEREASLETVKEQVQQEVHRKTRALKASVEQARALVKVTNVVPWEMDAATLTFTYISSQAMRVFGSSLQQAVGQPFNWSAVLPDDRAAVKQQFEALACGADGDHLETEFGVETEDGRVLQVRCLVSVHEEPGQLRVLRGVARDISSQKKLDLQLRHAQKLESVGRLAAGVAHEINTPVQFVSDSVHYVRDVVGDLTGLVVRYQQAIASIAQGGSAGPALAGLRQAEQEADLDYALEHLPKALDRSLEGLDRVATIVRSMKEFAHPDQKDMLGIDLNQAIASTLVIARHEYKYVADLVTEFGDLPTVVCHPSDINQVMLNIVVNAAHAIGDRVGDTGARGCITIRTWREDGDVVVSVGDTGTGIPAAVRDRIFDPFFTTKSVGKGTGQGLALARSVIVERHGGSLTFESAAGEGATFFIRLPISGASARAAA